MLKLPNGWAAQSPAKSSGQRNERAATITLSVVELLLAREKNPPYSPWGCEKIGDFIDIAI